MHLWSSHTSSTQQDGHVMTTDVDVWTQAAAHHQVRTRHTLTPAQVTLTQLESSTDVDALVSFKPKPKTMFFRE